MYRDPFTVDEDSGQQSLKHEILDWKLDIDEGLFEYKEKFLNEIFVCRVNTQDKLIYKALVDMGWEPPAHIKRKMEDEIAIALATDVGTTPYDK